MRQVAMIGVAVAALSACTPPAAKVEAPAVAALTCDQSFTRTIALTAPDAKDLITVRAIAAPPVPEAAKSTDLTEGGKLCTGATMVMTLHNGADNFEILGFTTPVGRLDMVGGATVPFTPEILKNLLGEWAEGMEVSTTDKAPAMLGPENPSIFMMQSLQRYKAIQAAKLPMFCMATSVHDRTCSFLEEGSSQLQPFYTENGA
jgi:hypothetical protein